VTGSTGSGFSSRSSAYGETRAPSTGIEAVLDSTPSLGRGHFSGTIETNIDSAVGGAGDGFTRSARLLSCDSRSLSDRARRIPA
jgi:hypothetical protein